MPEARKTEKIRLCPNCRKPVHWSEDNPFRPFCSNQCKLIDLGAWLKGERYIPGDPVPPLDDEDA